MAERMSDTDALVDELVGARDEFMVALDAVDARRLNAPGLAGDWSARELVAHLGYWAGHAVESIHAVEDGRAEGFGEGAPSVEELNQTVARVAREADLATVRRREEASFEAFVQRLRRMDPSLLAVRLPHYRITLAEAIREDGADHYREHAAELRGQAGKAPDA